MFFGGLLKIGINGGYNILTGLGLDPLDFGLNVSAAVNDDFPITVTTSQVLVIDRFDAVLADNVAGFITLVFVFLLLELFRADLADIAKGVTKHSVWRIPTLRCLFNPQGGKLQLVRINPGDVTSISVFLNED